MAHPTTTSLPMPSADKAAYRSDRRKTDSNHLRALSIFHYVLGVLTTAITAPLGFAFYHMAQMNAEAEATMAGMVQPGQAAQPEAWSMFQWFPLIFLGLYASGTALNLASGWCLARRKAWTFSVVVAGLDLFFVPFGTVLGVLTLIVLLRGSVGTWYAETKTA